MILGERFYLWLLLDWNINHLWFIAQTLGLIFFSLHRCIFQYYRFWAGSSSLQMIGRLGNFFLTHLQVNPVLIVVWLAFTCIFILLSGMLTWFDMWCVQLGWWQGISIHLCVWHRIIQLRRLNRLICLYIFYLLFSLLHSNCLFPFFLICLCHWLRILFWVHVDWLPIQ